MVPFFYSELGANGIRRIARSADKAGLLDGALAVDWALLFFHFAEVSGDSRWAEKARRLIRNGLQGAELLRRAG